MKSLDTYPESDLKLVYRVLHGHLMEHLELMDASLFDDLQTELQSRARTAGVDVSDHGAWAAWLQSNTDRAPLHLVDS